MQERFYIGFQYFDKGGIWLTLFCMEVRSELRVLRREERKNMIMLFGWITQSHNLDYTLLLTRKAFLHKKGVLGFKGHPQIEFNDKFVPNGKDTFIYTNSITI